MHPTTLRQLRCEYLPNPIGIDLARPRLSWQLDTERRGARQTAYRITVGTLPGTSDRWDSGKIDSDQSIYVEYGGPLLASRERVYWQVTVWDETDAETTSEAAFWEMGLLEESDWKAKWIQSDRVGGHVTTAPAPYMRKEFALASPVAKARLYITALGVYEAEINGIRIGDQRLAPGWTNYNKRVRYAVHDVTEVVKSGPNALGVIVGDGWYCGNLSWKGRQYYGERPLLLAQLIVTHEDGTETTVATGPDWRFSVGPILESDLYMGESYDARLDLGDWSKPGYNDSKWASVELAPVPNTQMVAQNTPVIRAVVELTPVEIIPLNGRYIVDFGQNMVGHVRLKVNGKKGQTLTLRHAEILDEKGGIYTANLRAAKQIDVITLPDGEFIWEPRFSFHGFRYMEIEGLTEAPSLDSLTGVVLTSDLPNAGSFDCSDPLIDQLQSNIQWGWRGNSVDLPTDCPQRDERLGWTGDAQVFVRTAAFNSDAAGFFEKYAQDLEDSQNEAGAIPPVCPDIELGIADGGPAWADAQVICPWTIYHCTGDRRILEKHYDSMVRWIEQQNATSKNGLRCYEGREGFLGFGDWLSINAETPIELIGTAFFAYSSGLMADVAGILGKPADQARFLAYREVARNAFERRFVTAEGLIYARTQTAYLLGLHFDLLPEALRPAAVQELVNDIGRREWKLSCGFVGSPYLNHVLSEGGRLDVAYRLLDQKEWPSWLYAVTKGATTIWERWDGWTHDKGFQDVGMNSFNHYAYGAIGAWLYQVVAGIELGAPGYKRILLQPRPGGTLTRAAASHESPYGLIESAWEITGEEIRWRVTVPPNTTALAKVPSTDVSRVVEESGVKPTEPGVYDLPAGAYAFVGPYVP